MSGRVPNASQAKAPTSSLYGQVAMSAFSSWDVGHSAAERRVPGANGVESGAASVRLKRVKSELMNASCDI